MSVTLDNPVTGASITILELSEELVRFSETGKQGDPGPVLHIHPLQEERFLVTRGAVGVRDGQTGGCLRSR